MRGSTVFALVLRTDSKEVGKAKKGRSGESRIQPIYKQTSKKCERQNNAFAVGGRDKNVSNFFTTTNAIFNFRPAFNAGNNQFLALTLSVNYRKRTEVRRRNR